LIYRHRVFSVFAAVLVGSVVAAQQTPAQPPVPTQSVPEAQAPATVPPLSAEPEPLRPTLHAALPQNIEDYWFAPARGERATRATALTDAAAAYAAGNYASSLGHARAAVGATGELDVYAQYYVGVSELRLAHPAEAQKAFEAVLAKKPEGALSLDAAVGRAEAMELRGDHAGAVDVYDSLASNKGAAHDEILARLARAAAAAGDRKRAADAWLKVYYEFPLSDAASNAENALNSFQDLIIKKDYKLDLGRALVLFGAKRYPEARNAFQDLQPRVSGDDRELVDLRIAECDFFLKHYKAARDEVQPYLDKASRKAEAKFFDLSALRSLGEQDQAVTLTRALVNEFPDSSWSDEALNNLGTHYILTNQDDLAAATFKEAYEKFPTGSHAERAAWKYGWWAYTTGKYAETARVFEAAAAAFPRSDYRPPWLYWSGRAREKLGQREVSDARMRLVYTDYMNSYYGRLASRRAPSGVTVAAGPGSSRVGQGSAPAGQGPNLVGLGNGPDLDAPTARAASLQTPQRPPVAPPPPNAPLVRRLLMAGLLDDGLSELRYAQRAWGTSPAIEATMAWVYHQKGDLRRAITVMRRAYPQFLAAGGEAVPAEILQIIFPLTYWDPIKKNSAAHNLDPYVTAALIAQESTFDASAHSPANAWGLMQIVPSTGRRLAMAAGVRRFSTRQLTNADVNIKLGTLYFSRLVQQFGGTYYALASYNAGENRVVRWKAERPGMEEDEFIDDIPFPETQNYVKRILGTAEDYRHLYGEVGATPGAKPAAKKPATTKKTPAKKTTTKTPTKKKKKSGGTP
jgi:soluble lytic murein transglycosylase